MDYKDYYDYNVTYPDHDPFQEEITNSPFKIIQMIVMSVAALISIIGNGTVVAIISSSDKLKDNIFYYYVLNIAVANILDVSQVPFTVTYIVKQSFIFGSFVCRIVNAFTYISIHISNLFLAYLAIDCFHRSRGMLLDKRTLIFRVTSSVTWVVLLITGIVIGYNSEHDLVRTGYQMYFCYLNLIASYLPFFTSTLMILLEIVIISVYVILLYTYRLSERFKDDETFLQQRKNILLLNLSFLYCYIPFTLCRLMLEFGFMNELHETLIYLTMPLLVFHSLNCACVFIWYVPEIRSKIIFWRRGNSNPTVSSDAEENK